MQDDELLTREATQRIASSRSSQLAFGLKSIAPSLSDSDAEILAIAFLESDDANKGKFDRADIRARLEAICGSREHADRIAKTIGL